MGTRLLVKVWTMVGVAVIGLGAASAARADEVVVTKVPFDFIVNGVRMPAGNYTVTQLNDRALVSIASADRRHFAFALTIPLAPDQAGPVPKLVFEQFDGNHFLERIVADENIGREIVLTPAEMKRESDRAEASPPLPR